MEDCSTTPRRWPTCPASGQKAMDDVIRQKVEQETENSVNDVSAFISKNKMNDDF